MKLVRASGRGIEGRKKGYLEVVLWWVRWDRAAISLDGIGFEYVQTAREEFEAR